MQVRCRLPHPSLSICLGAFALLAVLPALACGDGDSGSSTGKVTLDPKRGDELAHAAILAATDLPGSGWDVSRDDEFSDDVAFPDTAPCGNVKTKSDQAKAQAKTDRAGRAERQYSRDSESGITTDVEVEVSVYSTVKTVTDTFKLAKDVFTGTDFMACVQDTYAEAVNEGVKLEVKEGKLLATAPNGGVGRAIDVNLELNTDKAQIHLETYLWPFGNVGVQVTVSGDSTDLTREVVKAALAKTQAKLEAASK